jgi:pimeloyl-ACP methyl ester carboxylesterase
MAKSSDVILVHGAWADGSSWAKVIPLLAARDHSVTAVQLPLTSLGDDVATVKRAIALASGPTILAGHSYGGAVISEAGNDPKVEALVYIAAFPRTRVSRQDLSVRASSLRRWVRKSALMRRGI